MTMTLPKNRPRCVIAIGGSAGALDAYERFFKALPEDIDAAIVVLQHMDPEKKSLLHELLGRMTKLPVHLAKNGEAIQAGHVYALEPGITLALSRGLFVGRPNMDTEDRRHPIDHFFSSLATEYGSHAVGVVVSGTGSDGTNGLRLIQEAGGRTLVQVPSEAKFDGMPESAISEGVVDQIMPVAEIARTLSNFIECAPTPITEVDHSVELKLICEILHRKTGHDFSSYKKSTVARRVERRLQANLIPTLSAYIEFLEKDLAEPRALLRDLLISVTQFFRDPEAFSALQDSAIPRLFERARESKSVRVWVPACATGEEAYTIAILLKEYQRRNNRTEELQIFATDIDRTGLEFARQGVYPQSVSEQVPEEYLTRYFRKHERGLQTTKELREICIFSEHSLLKNPPFSRIDLISCRNLFIYWEPELQNRILPLFHYALNPSGFLFLGPAENVTTTTELFRPMDKKNRIFQKLGSVSRNHPVFSVSHLAQKTPMPAELVSIVGEREPGRIISSLLLENFSPPAFVISEHGEIAFYSGKTGKYLEPPTGVPSNNIFDVIARPLRPELHALVHQSIKTQTEAFYPSLTYEKEGSIVAVKITVRPMGEFPEGSGLYLVVLQEIISPKSKDEALQQGLTLPDESSRVRQLEAQLQDTREHLQSTIEEVKSSNEELLSMNEELQSANEELQTSKEELQSTNEELETVNSELSKKVEELDVSNSDLQNFFQGSQVPILFLDREFRIQKFTPAATRIFRLIPGDLGRGITDITSFLEDTDFSRDFDQVLQSLQPLEKELRTKDHGCWFIMRVGPYRTVNNVIAGVVVTFSDVTELKKAQESNNRLAAIVESSSDAIISKNLNSIVTSWNEAAEAMFGYRAQEIIGRPITTLFPEERLHEEKMILSAIFKGEKVSHYETERLTKDGTKLQVSVSVSPIKDVSGKIIGAAKIVRDITAQKETENALKEAVRSRDEFLSIASHELKTPLTSLKINIQMRKRSALAKDASAFTFDKLVHMTESDDRQINRITHLIDDMLDITRIQTGKLAINPTPVELCSLVKEVADRYTEQLAAARCELSIDPCMPIHGEWDHFRIEQVVTNLLNNAIKYGAGRPINIKVEQTGDTARISVKDYGIGIAKEDQKRIFEQFERAVRPNEVSGLGLGLYIVTQILKAHAGSIHVISEVGKGAEFIVELPLKS